MSDLTRDDIVRELLPTWGVDRSTIERVVDAFGADADRLLEATEATLEEVAGVGQSPAMRLRWRLDLLQKRGLHRSEREAIQSILEQFPILEYGDDPGLLLDSAGEEVLCVYWDTGGGLGAGADRAYRIGDIFVVAPDAGTEPWSGPYEFFDDAVERTLWLSTATLSIRCAYPVEEWIHAAGMADGILDAAPEHEIRINGVDWPVARLFALRKQAGTPPERRRTLPLPDGLDLERCQAAILDGYRNGSVDLSLETVDWLLDEDRYDD